MTEHDPELMWERFIAHMEAKQPLRSGEPHMNFLGSIESYRKLFLEANRPQPEHGEST